MWTTTAWRSNMQLAYHKIRQITSHPIEYWRAECHLTQDNISDFASNRLRQLNIMSITNFDSIEKNKYPQSDVLLGSGKMLPGSIVLVSHFTFGWSLGVMRHIQAQLSPRDMLRLNCSGLHICRGLQVSPILNILRIRRKGLFTIRICWMCSNCAVQSCMSNKLSWRQGATYVFYTS